MKTSISLKQLRADPREYIRLLNSGYEVEITEHRRPISAAVRPASAKQAKGNVAEVLKTISELPKIKVLDPNLDTVAAVKKAKIEYLVAKYKKTRS